MSNQTTATNYKEIAKQARIKVLDLIFKAQTSHVGSNLSAIDIMAVLFDKVDPEKDEVILSAGWKAAAWYYFLWKKGIITEEELNSFCQNIFCYGCNGTGESLTKATLLVPYRKCERCNGIGKENSKFIGLTEPMNRWGLRFAGGSMGYGLPAAVGFALSKKLKGEDGKVYVLMSDGELQCGTTYEARLIAESISLENLVVIIDKNEYQAMGKTKDILCHNILDTEEDITIDGHSYNEIEKALSGEYSYGSKIMPWIFANTIKGKGVSFMENNNDWHYLNISKENYEKALKELNV